MRQKTTKKTTRKSKSRIVSLKKNKIQDIRKKEMNKILTRFVEKNKEGMVILAKS